MADSHDEMPQVEATLTDLEAYDFRPFRALCDLPLGLSAHVLYTAIDGELPGTLSPKVITDIIRGTIAFDGLLLSDDLSMDALSGNLGERAEAALAAGCDIALHCNGELGEMSDVVSRVGAMSQEASHLWAKISECKNEVKTLNTSKLKNELNNLIKERLGA